jgi:undecaprenyl diphosphate synthase
VERIVEAAPGLGITVLTLYAFSSDNWNRPMPEVAALMRLLQAHLRTERARALRNGVRVEIVGRRDRLPAGVLREIERTERATRFGTRLWLRLAVDYSSRDAILEAATRAAAEGRLDRTTLEAGLLGGAPVVDLLIRTGGEQRLSDFLLWECAYAELFFSATMWPDFSVAELRDILGQFSGRQRRFGGIPPVTPDIAGTRRVG